MKGFDASIFKNKWAMTIKPKANKDNLHSNLIKEDLYNLVGAIEDFSNQCRISYLHDTMFNVYMTFDLARKFIKAYEFGSVEEKIRYLLLIDQIEAVHTLKDQEDDRSPSVEDCSYRKPELKMNYKIQDLVVTNSKECKYVLFDWAGNHTLFNENLHDDMLILGAKVADYSTNPAERYKVKLIAIKSSDIAQKLVKCCTEDFHEAEEICTDIKKFFSTSYNKF